MLSKLKLRELGKRLNQQRIFLRTDFNVPIKDSQVANDFRIKSSLQTIDDILSQGPHNLIIGSHLGRPNGKPKKDLSLLPVYQYLSKIYKDKIVFLNDPLGNDKVQEINDLKNKIILLENLRFYPEEEGKYKNSEGEKVKVSKTDQQAFRDKLNNMCDIFVNDAFGTMHRAHSSIVGIEKKYKAAGYLVEKELEYFGKFMENPTSNTTIVLGGAKVEDKIPIIKNLVNLCNDIIIGGGMAFTFLKAMHGTKIGKSLFEEHCMKDVVEIIKLAKEKNVKIHLPVDILCAQAMTNDSPTKTFSVSEGIPDDWIGFDIGKKSTQNFKEVIQSSKTILSNGLMGVFEVKQFAQGSIEILEEIAKQTKKGATSIIGGGDTAGAANKMGLNLSHVSTGGGASLELLGGLKLPGVEHLSNRSVLDLQ